MGTISAGLTSFYSLRLLSLTFLTYPNASKSVYNGVHDAPVIVIIPLIILSLLAIFFGYVASDIYVGMGSDFLSNSVFVHPSHVSLVEAHFGVPLFIKLLPAIITMCAAGLALYLYNVLPNYLIGLTGSFFGRTLYRFFNGKYFVDVIYNHYIINASLVLGYTISKVLDRGAVELVGPHGISLGLSVSSKDIAKLDTGNLTSYALYLMLALVGLTFFLFSPKLTSANTMSDPRLVLIFLTGLVLLNPLYRIKK